MKNFRILVVFDRRDRFLSSMLSVSWKSVVPSRSYNWLEVSPTLVIVLRMKISDKNLFLVQFLSNHPVTFRICSRDPFKKLKMR